MIDRAKKIAAKFYATATGRRPVREWLLSLSKEDRRVIGHGIQKVEFGWPITMPYCRPLGRGLWEVRSSLSGSRIARVIFCIKDGAMVLLHGFEKTTQKTLARHRPCDHTQTGDRRMKKRKRGYVDHSETFDEFLAKDGLLAETEESAIKEIIADQIKLAMDKKGLSKTAMAARMKTSRRQLDRLLDPANPSVTLATLRRAASAVGRNLRVELE